MGVTRSCEPRPGPRRLDDYSRQARCPRCKLTPGLCVCSSIVPLEVPVRFTVIRHGTERASFSNTGGLVPLLLHGARLLDYAVKGEELDVEEALGAGPETLLLFPHPHAAELDPRTLACGSDLVIIDATWPKARRMARRVRALRELPSVRLPAGPVVPRHTLRKSPGPALYSTLESALRVVELLDHPAASSLRSTADMILTRRLYLRGKLGSDSMR